MARFVDHSAGDYTKEEYKRMATYYSLVIGLLVSKSGPVDISSEDIFCYQLSKLSPCMSADGDRDGIRVFLMGEDEDPENPVHGGM
jgi:hypothetical protein